MWETKYFKDLESANEFININSNKYQTQLIFVDSGFYAYHYAVEYKKLKRI